MKTTSTILLAALLVLASHAHTQPVADLGHDAYDKPTDGIGLGPTGDLDCQNDRLQPLDLLLFGGATEGCMHRLYWTTSSEMGIAHFVLEASPDGRKYEEVGKALAENGEKGASYSIEAAARRQTYYRLRVVETSGPPWFSDAILLGFHCGEGMTARLFPNPVFDKTKFLLDLPDIEGVMIVRVHDLQGRIVSILALQALPGPNWYEIDCSGIPKGIYHLSIAIGNLKTKALRLFKR